MKVVTPISYTFPQEGVMNLAPTVVKPPLQKFADFARSLFKEQRWIVSMLYRKKFIAPRNEYIDCAQPINWKVHSHGLYVLVHGLRGHPSHWTKQFEILDQQQPEYDVIAPFVFKEGDCSLEEAEKPILETICDYIKRHPKKPVCLIGVSNGGRIVSWLEFELRRLFPDTPVKVSAVAGVHFGTRLVSKYRSWPVAKHIIGSNAIRDELAYGSDKARELLGKMISGGVEHHLRDFEYYATPEDLCVDVDSALPPVSNAKYYLVPGEGHNTIVEAIAPHQIQSCKAWMSRFSN